VSVCVQDDGEFVVQMLNGIGDFIDLKHALNPHLRPNFHQMSLQQMKDYLATNGHCSALVKVLCSYFVGHLILIILVILIYETI